MGILGLGVAGAVLLEQRGEPKPSATPTAPSVVANSPLPAAAPAPAPAQTSVPVQPAVSAPVAAAPAPAAPEMVSEEGPLLEPNAADMTFADSSTRLLQPSEVYPLGPSTLKVARNEIFARKGMRFKTPFLRDWLSRFAWYQPRFDRVPLNDVERRNIALIREAEARYQ